MQLKGLLRPNANMKFAANVNAKKPTQRKLSIKEDENANNLLNISTSEYEDTPILSPPCHPAIMAASYTPEMICASSGAENINLNRSRQNLNCRLTLDNRTPADEGVVDCTNDYFEGSHDYFKDGRSRVNSVTEDSGFISSENDDKDDLIARSLARLNGNSLDHVEDFDENGNQPLSRVTKSLSCTDIDSPLSNTDSVHSSMNSLDSLCYRRHSRNSVSSCCSKPLQKPPQHRAQTRDCTNITSTDSTSESSLSVSTLSIDSSVSIKPKSVQRRRRAKDQNNNRPDLVSKNIHTMLPKSPGRFNDCFQEHGILSFVACIVYTLTLMVLFGVLGLACDTMKSAIGKEDLKEIRQDLVKTRRHRTTALASR